MHSWEDILVGADRKLLDARTPMRPTVFGTRPCLLVIDMNIGALGEDRPAFEQQDRHPGACGAGGWTSMKKIGRLLGEAHRARTPVIYSRHIFRAIHQLPRADDPKYIYSELNPASELHPQISPKRGDLIIEKQKASVFAQTNLLSILLTKKIDTLLLTGNSTSGCVRATAIDALNYDFNTIVIEECVFDRFEISHKVSLFDLWFKYCSVIHFEEALEYIKSLGTPKPIVRSGAAVKE